MPSGDPRIHGRGDGFFISPLSFTTQIAVLKEELAATKTAMELMKGRIHMALQDAFQAGGIVAVETLQQPTEFIARKHKYCDKALSKMLKENKK